MDEFAYMCYAVITAGRSSSDNSLVSGVANAALESFGEDDGEEEEIPEEIADLSPEKQEAAVKKMAFTMLTLGTFVVLLFSGKILFSLTSSIT